MPADIHVFRCLTDNVGLLIRDAGSEACAAVDVPDAEAVLAAAQQRRWSVTHVLVTHRHGDHVQGVEEVKRRTGCHVVAPRRAAAAVPSADALVAEGDPVSIGSLEGVVMETPGHCADHVSYWFAGERILLAGDTLFTLGCGRILEGSPAEMWHSLGRLAALPDDARLFCGHDYTLANARFALAADPDNPALRARAAEAEAIAAAGGLLVPSRLGDEKATNPFLRAGEPALARAVDRVGEPAERVFEALRAWKNRF